MVINIFRAKRDSLRFHLNELKKKVNKMNVNLERGKKMIMSSKVRSISVDHNL